MFKAIRDADRESLCALAKTSIGKGKDATALLCLDHVFSPPFELRNLLLAQVQARLSLYLDYIRLLNRLLRDGSLAPGSSRQRLFGFQVLGEGRYLSPECSLLHEKLTNQSGSSGQSPDGYRCSYDELSWGIVQLIRSRIRDRTEIQNNACRDVYGFSPCYHLLVQKRCNPPQERGPCPFQHIQLEQITLDWYHARLRLILLQFQILDLARCYNFHVAKYVLAHSARNACEYSSNIKLLAWDITLGTSSALSEARITREY